MKNTPNKVPPLSMHGQSRLNVYILTATLNVHGHESTLSREAVAWAVAGDPGITVGTIVENTGLSPRTVTDAIRHFIDRGVFKQEIDPTDRRLRRVYLTPKGKEGQRQLIDYIFAARRRLLQADKALREEDLNQEGEVG